MPDPDRSDPFEPCAVPDRPLPGISESEMVGLGQLGEYRLLEKLGEGGMGVVYRAWHVELERVVALKVVRSDRLGDPQAVERFRREIRAAGKLEHPNIVLAHDARQIGGTYLLVMEFIEGLDFAQLLQRLGPLPIADACEAARQAALGLQHAHKHQLIHRDIKPSNLMLARNGTVKILDLGLARLQSAPTATGGTTGAGFAIGTPDYMAPEQASDSREVDARSDIYGLGCTLYMLLTGDPPFSGSRHQQAYEKMMAHVHEPPMPVRDHRPEVSDSLNEIVQRMLAKEPGDRFATASDVAQVLDAFALGTDLAGLLSVAIGRPVTKRISAVKTPRAGPSSKARPIWPFTAIVALILAALLAWIAWRPTDHPHTESAGTVTPPPLAQHSPEFPGWIVLSWTVRGIGKPDLWLFRPDGRGRVQITNSPRHFDVHPCFSPDARQLAFIRGRELDESTTLWVCRSDGTDPRELVVPETDVESRVMSPVWKSDTEILYVCDPRLDRMPDMELRQIDVASGEDRLVFHLQQTAVGSFGIVTDISPARDRLAMVLQRRILWPMANIYICDLNGGSIETIWQDTPDECKDARALWSPDGSQIAWHHNFTRGGLADHFYYGVGLARRTDGQWKTQLQPQADGQVTPLAWTPDGSGLLCAQMSDDETHATLVLLDHEFRQMGTLFELEVGNWQPGKQDLGRLADWAIVPGDIPLPDRP